MYEWANQKTFAEICELTDAQEGSIVRTILRLDGLLKNTKNACRLMGNNGIILIQTNFVNCRYTRQHEPSQACR